MPTELKVPEVGESVTEVEIGRWLVKEGDAIAVDQDIVELETDKVNQTLPAPVTGALVKILLNEGDTAQVGDVIAHIEKGAKGNTPSAVSNGQAAPAITPVTRPATAPAKETTAPAAPLVAAAAESVVMPAAQRLLDENNLQSSQVDATGPGGRLLKEDVQNHLNSSKSTPAAPKRSEVAHSATVETSGGGDRSEEVVRMTPLRRTIAKALINAQQNAALLTTFNEVDMTNIMALRKKYQDSFIKQHGVKLGFMSFFVKASIDALKQFPSVNAEVRGNEIVYKHYYDIGIAIGGGKGLVVPVLRNAERMGFADVEKAIGAYAVKAKENKLQMSDLTGGSFTITNGGIYGSLLSTPIVNPPQSGVLGMHGIIRRPIALGTPGIDERIEIRPMMYLALTYDHRIVDGREAVTFLKRMKEAIEDPARMLVEA